MLRLDQRSHTASFVGDYGRSGNFEAAYMGNTQPLANGNVLVGWGNEPYFSEYSRSGRLLYEAELPGPDLTYRATLQQWTGLPLWPPAGAARRRAGATTVYASWNGATQVASWRVLATGAGGGAARTIATRQRSGFETAIPVPGSYSSFRVQARGADGRTLGTSRPFSPPS